MSFAVGADEYDRFMGRYSARLAPQLAGGRGPLSLFWTAVRQLDPGAQEESGLAGARAGHLAELFEAAGLHDVNDTELAVRVEYASFDDWWGPFTLGVGPAGAYAAGLDPARRERASMSLSRGADAGPDGQASPALVSRGGCVVVD